MIQNIDPIIFSLGPIAVRYYGVLYMMGFLITYYFFRYLLKKGVLPSTITVRHIEDYIFYAVIWTVFGARLFEVLFYNLNYFIANPIKVFAVWEGGLSFHGGLLGVVLYSYFFSKKHKINFLLWIDLCSIPAAFGLFIGRLANFINGELYGFPVADQTNPPFWAVLFQRTDPLHLYRYPTQILESFSNLIVFFILIFVFKKILKKNSLPLVKGGLLSGIFCIGYGVLRFLVEYLKDYEQNTWLGMSTGQLLGMPVIFIGIALVVYVKKRDAVRV